MAEKTKQNKKQEKKKVEATKENSMRKIEIEKVVLSIGGTGKELEKGAKLLKKLTNKKVVKTQSRKRIPGLGVSPGLEVGCMVTLRGKEAEKILKRVLPAIDNQIREKQISKNTFSFGIPEYIEIPDVEYQREIGIIGLRISVSFYRKGKRIEKRRKKKQKLAEKQHISKEEIINILENRFNVEVIKKEK